MKSFVLVILLVLSLNWPGSNAKVPIGEFFPFGFTYGDSNLTTGNLDDGSSDKITLNVAFPFFDNLHDALWVNINGGMSFLNAISTYTPICTAVPLSYRMIAPFWADVDLRWGGNVYYRQTFDQAVLEKATREIRSASLDANQIELKWAFVTTWFNVSFYGAGGCTGGVNRRNSFQSVITTDGIHSFALFYYEDIKWTTGTASGGNCQGLGGQRAKGGFDAGDGQSLITIPGSCTADVITISDRSNYQQSGKWVFRVDNAQILPAGCNHEFEGRVRVSPAFIDLFGHLPLEIFGPCTDDNTQVLCRFHEPVNGVVESGGLIVGTSSDSKVICRPPFIYSTGRINLDIVLTHNGQSKVYSGFVNAIPPQEDEKRLNVQIITQNITQEEQVNLQFSYDPELINGSKVILSIYSFNLEESVWERKFEAQINIYTPGQFVKLFNAKQLPRELFDSSISFAIKEIVEDGVYTSNFTQYDPANEIFSLMDISSDIYWLLYPRNEQDCLIWLNKDQGIPDDQIICPQTSEWATADPQFEPDPECLSPGCELHPLADFCIRSVNPGPNGGGQQCCYLGEVLLTSPSSAGSTDKCHPSNELCHLNEDVLPWKKCCQNVQRNLESFELCSQYFDKRPINKGDGYEPPVIGGGAGDPHITTFDNLEYTFNGAGEFWMIKDSSDMPASVQSRMEVFSDDGGPNKSATIFTAFVMKCQNSSIIQVQRSQIRTVDIYVDGALMELNQDALSFNFRGAHVRIADDLTLVKVSFGCGIGYDITTDYLAFSIMAISSRSFKGKTRGLLGVYDDNPDNDLQDQNGNVIAFNASLRDIHYNFGLKWRVLKTESLFIYSDKSYEDYNLSEFVPSLTEPNINAVPNQVKTYCQMNQNCIYDYITTGNAKVSNLTRVNIEKLNETATLFDKTIITCPPLSRLENGYVRAQNYFPGSIAEYGCYTNYTIQGETTLLCKNDGSWNSTAVPECVNKQQEVQVIAGTAKIKFEISFEKLKSILQYLNKFNLFN